ncbi:hypothetical protein [Bacteroides sp.]|uniref:hypothetical protein n=1 Tax=Bacteroides sp. TaxID=29523 RepID=UPI0025BE4DA0|nr:hypothetical protein [Bacteroides sp.]
MKLHHIKLLSFLLAVLLTSCKESVDTPPFNFFCEVKLINKDGSSPLKENRDKISEITVDLIKPQNNDTQIIGVSYIEYYECLRIQIADIKNGGNYEREYSIEIQYPENIRKGKDTIRIKYQFKDHRSSVIGAFYNDKKAQYMEADATYFEIEN